MNGTPKASEPVSPKDLYGFGCALVVPGDSQWGGPCLTRTPQLFRLQAKVGLQGLLYAAREPGSLAG